MEYVKIKPNEDVYLTRDTRPPFGRVDIVPAALGIRKFHGCVEWGVAWCAGHREYRISARTDRVVPDILPVECKARFGFIPRKGTAWLIEYTAKGKMKKTKVDLAFSP